MSTRRVAIAIPFDAALSIERYTQAAVELEVCGDASTRQLEEARSYAVEALRGLLRANPEVFDFCERIAAAHRLKAGR